MSNEYVGFMIASVEPSGSVIETQMLGLSTIAEAEDVFYKGFDVTSAKGDAWALCGVFGEGHQILQYQPIVIRGRVESLVSAGMVRYVAQTLTSETEVKLVADEKRVEKQDDASGEILSECLGLLLERCVVAGSEYESIKKVIESKDLRGAVMLRHKHLYGGEPSTDSINRVRFCVACVVAGMDLQESRAAMLPPRPKTKVPFGGFIIADDDPQDVKKNDELASKIAEQVSVISEGKIAVLHVGRTFDGK